MVPEKPWTRHLGPVAWIFIATALIPALVVAGIFFWPSEDGEEVAVMDEPTEHIAVDVDQATENQEILGAFTYTEYASDDTDLIGDAMLKIVDFTNNGTSMSEPRELTSVQTGGNVLPHRFNVSNDGARLAYTTTDQIRVSRLDGTNDAEVTSIFSINSPFVWSEDSNFLAYQKIIPVNVNDPTGSQTSSVSLFDPSDGSTVTTRLELGLTHQLLRLTRDRLFVKRQIIGDEGSLDSRWGYYTVNAARELDPTFNELRIFPDNFIDSYVSEDGRFWYYIFANSNEDGTIGAPYEIHKITVEDGTDEQIYSTDSRLYNVISANNQIVFSAFDGLFELTPVPGGAARQIISRETLISDENENRYIRAISTSAGNELIAAALMGAEKEVDGVINIVREIDSIIFIPFAGAPAETSILSLPVPGNLQPGPSTQHGWQWVGL